MLSVALTAPIKAGLSALGLYDTRRPASYAEGARPITTIPVPVIPRPTPDPLSPEGLAAAEAEALAPRQVATPEGFEPGMMEDLAGLALTVDNVEAVLEEMVRPALNADGGDITLIRIDEGDIYVRLVGACNTCPSSVMTMKMGVERLLQEEFPDMGELIQIDSGFDPADVW